MIGTHTIYSPFYVEAKFFQFSLSLVTCHSNDFMELLWNKKLVIIIWYLKIYSYSVVVIQAITSKEESSNLVDRSYDLEIMFKAFCLSVGDLLFRLEIRICCNGSLMFSRELDIQEIGKHWIQIDLLPIRLECQDRLLSPGMHSHPPTHILTKNQHQTTISYFLMQTIYNEGWK